MSFPFGCGEVWKLNDIKCFRKYFDRIVVVPLSFGGQPEQVVDLPEDIELVSPLFPAEVDILARPPRGVTRLRIRHLLSLLWELCRCIGTAFPQRMSRTVVAYLRATSIAQQIARSRVLETAPGETVSCFFFWGYGAAEGLPWLTGCDRAVVGFHGYDLYEERRGRGSS